jgi:hypothetical protein
MAEEENEQSENEVSEFTLLSSNEDSDDPELSSESLSMELPFKRMELGDKEYNKFIKNCERLVRSSPEYKEYVSFVRESFNASVCALTNENFDETGDIEIHHYPLTLYDICQTVLDSKLDKEEKFSSFDVALEVIKLHFAMFVGIVPLSGTLHKKYHLGYLDIPIQAVVGNYNKIGQLYDLSSELDSKINLAKQITHSPYQGNWLGSPDNPNYLEQEVITDDEDDDPFVDDVDDQLQAKIEQYQQNQKK